jgi:hypothetical protein
MLLLFSAEIGPARIERFNQCDFRHWFSSTQVSSSHFCHSRAWLPREESRSFWLTRKQKIKLIDSTNREWKDLSQGWDEAVRESSHSDQTRSGFFARQPRTRMTGKAAGMRAIGREPMFARRCRQT